MKDLAILVDNKNDSTEAQDLLFSMGYKWRGLGEISKSYFYPRMNKYFIFMNKNEMDLQMAGYFAGSSRSYAESRFKEITLPELRDLVVLKRNSIDDATHEDKNDPEFKYRLIDNHWYVITEENPVWRKDSIDLNEAPLFIKPIEKPMKEYLFKYNDQYTLVELSKEDAGSNPEQYIEVPEGATYYAKDASLGKSGNFFFRLRSDDFDFEAVWLESNWIQAIFNVENQDVLWQRNNNQTIASAVESSHPEELPFIDDEPKITTAKGSELDYIAKIHDMRDRYNGESDEDYRYQLEHYISRKEPSLNDQYAEIEKVRQTLNQRQSQYGSFEDVAMFTEQMVDVMRKGYYEKLAYNQKMALYMICSKMARIVNGNPNHKDSWHNIAGYATLIDNELESEKDMPF